jgi:ABC-type transporter Mla subunit MlaD
MAEARENASAHAGAYGGSEREQQRHEGAAHPSDGSGTRHTGERAEAMMGSMRDRAGDMARDMADAQKDRGAQKIEDIAEAVDDAADAVAPHMQGAADYIHEAAQNLTRFSSALRQRSVDDVLSDVSRFARAQPAAFFGASVLAGVALTRFLKSAAPATTHRASETRASRNRATMRRAPGPGGVAP